MKKVIFAVALCVAAVAMLGGPALAAGQRLPLELRCGNTSGGGSVVLHDSKAPNSMEMELVLRGALPNQGYDVICRTWLPDYSNYSETTVGTVYTNNGGAARGSYTLSVATPGDYVFSLELRKAEAGHLLQYDAGPVTLSFN
jgi:hypothetical protein